MEKECLLTNNCNFQGIRPAMADLPYPPVQVNGKCQAYADLLSIDYCGAVSELSAITQYINNENRLSCNRCSIAKTILSIAMAEMMHLQKLGELIFLFGGNVNFIAKYQKGRERQWTPAYLSIPGQPREMVIADIEAEKAAIKQYRMHIHMINDNCANAVIERIIKDEEYHIMLLNALLKEI